METISKIDSVDKILRVINSCNTIDHVLMCYKIVENYGRLFGKKFAYYKLMEHAYCKEAELSN